MKLTVEFKRPNGLPMVVNLTDIGLDLADYVRYKDPSISHLSIDDMIIYPSKSDSVVVELTEDQGRLCGHFKEQSRIAVLVGDDVTDKLETELICDPNVTTTKTEYITKRILGIPFKKEVVTQTISRVSIRRLIYKKGLLEKWKEAGYPLKWGDVENDTPNQG